MTAAAAPYRPRGLRWACLAIWALGALLLATPLNEILSRPLIDQQLRVLAPPAPMAGVTVVDIDELSLRSLQKDFGSWPYRRDVHALAIDELRRAGVRAIAYDLLLSDEHPGDAAMAREIARPGAPVLLAAIALDQNRAPIQTKAETAHETANGSGPSSPNAADIVWPQLALPSPSIVPRSALSGTVGVVTMPLDSDGRLRRWPLWHEAAGQRWPALPLAVWQATHRAEASAWPPPGPSGLTIPLGVGSGAVSRLPFASVMDVALQRAPQQALADRLRDHVVFVGAGALMADSVISPGGPMSGTEALAQAYAALRERRLARLPSSALDAALAMLAGLPLLLAAGRRSGSLRQGLGMLAAAVLLLAAIMAAALWGREQLTQPAAAGAVLACSALALAVWRQRHLVHVQRQLVEQRLLAETASRAKSEFLAKVSHEIRTPMTALLGVAELLSRSKLPPAEQQLVSLFTDAGHSLQTLLNDMLDLSRVEAGRLELHPIAFSLNASLSRVSALVRPRAERKGLALRLELAPGLPDNVRGDSLRLEQVLLNLLTNAVNFTEDGEVSLAVSRMGAAGSTGDQVQFVVTDTGIGIAPNKLELIFEPFTQADGSLSRNYGGSGLGLSIVRKLVELMGGSIQARSEPGQGSQFTLQVPLPETLESPAAQAAPETASALGSPGKLSGLRVLLVEDNDVNVVIFSAMLQNLNLHVDIASNGVEGLERLRSGSYDLAFVDIQMPVMDGLTMTSLLRQDEARNPKRPRLPVIALTANAYPADAKLSLEAGCDLHLPKPYNRQQLLDALNQFAPAAALARVSSTAAANARAVAQIGAAEATPIAHLDHAGAVARLGSDERYGKLKRHARVFIGGWEADYQLAERQGQRERQRALVRDLKTVASNIGAVELTQRVTVLESLLAAPAPPATGAATGAAEATTLRAVQDSLPAVLLALETS